MGSASLLTTSRHVGRRIAELRIKDNLTQAQFAEKAEISLRYLQSVESGQNLTLDSLVKFANLLRVPVIDLFRAPRSQAPRPGRPPMRRRTK